MYFSTFGQQFLDYARHIGVEPLAAPRGLGALAVTQFGVFDQPEPVQALQRQITAQFGDAVHTVITNGRFLEICWKTPSVTQRA